MSAAKRELYRPRGAFDLLRLPGLRQIARMRTGRLVLQTPFFIVAALLIYDGFTGPELAAQNLATVAPWVHYRGIVVLAILLAGNLFCMGCPFTIPRTLAKRLSLRKRRFPRLLRNKWLAIAALFGIFFAYEWLDLWASPALTAWLIVAYFVASFALEAFFGESAFCKYVCPLGTFNFVYSTASPTQITAKNLDVCASCVGKECVNGSYAEQTAIRIDEIPTLDGGVKQVEVVHGPQGTPGCGTELFVPQIKSNLDCVLCLDCVRACPHDNVALMARVPGRELLQPGAWPKRWDVSMLVIGLSFLGLFNAFGMVPPVFDLMRTVSDFLGLDALEASLREFVVLALLFMINGLLVPLTLTLSAAYLSRRAAGATKKYSQRETVAAFAPAFIPVGFGIWIAHYGFHFLIGALTIVPVFQNFLLDHRITFLGQPDWTMGGLPESTVGFVQVLALVGGFLWSAWIAQRVALRLYRRDAVPGLLPWMLLLLGLTAVGVWIFSLPMEMRGTVFLH